MLKISKILILVLVIGGFFSINLKAAPPELPILVKEEKPEKAPRPLYVPDEIIVKFKKDVNDDAIRGLKQAQGVLEKYISPFAEFRVLKIPKGKTVEELVEIFSKNPLVEYAEPNYYAYASFVPNDPLYSYQWHFDNPTYGGIQMEQAWDISTGTPGIVVAVLDTGVAYENYPTKKCWHLDTYNAYSGYSWWCGVLDDPNWATPPGYTDYWEQYLTHAFDLTGATGNVTLSFRHKYDMERNFDFGYVEVSNNNGATWTTFKTYTNNAGPPGGRPVNWTQDSVNLTSYVGSDILIRFRFNSDYSYSDGDGKYNSDGAWYIDEARLTDNSGTLFYDDMEGGADPGWTVDSLPFQKAPDLAGTNFWVNTNEIPGNGIDDDLNTKIDDINGWDFIDNDAHPNDDGAHGTHVAGTIAQTTHNNLGVAGAAFNTAIMPVKVLGPAGGTYQQVADGISYATDNGAKVINMSLGGSSPSLTLENAVNYAYNNGVTVIAACGNSNVPSCDYPARYTNSIAVGATQYNETRAPYSNYGTGLDLVAPGGNTGVDQNSDGQVDGVLQNTFGDTVQDWGYYLYQGTSMATPHVAGTAALLLAKSPTLTPSQTRNILESTAEDLGSAGYDSTFGWGLIDARAALASLTPAVSITLTTDGATPFGILPLGSVQDTTPAGLNDVQTVRIDTGPANLNVKTTVFSDGAGNSWSLGSTNGPNQVKWEFGTSTAGNWNTFLTPAALSGLAQGLTAGSAQNLYLRLTLPTASTATDQYSASVTIVATAP